MTVASGSSQISYEGKILLLSLFSLTKINNERRGMNVPRLSQLWIQCVFFSSSSIFICYFIRHDKSIILYVCILQEFTVTLDLFYFNFNVGLIQMYMIYTPTIHTLHLTCKFCFLQFSIVYQC